MSLLSCDAFHVNGNTNSDCNLDFVLEHRDYWFNNSCCGKGVDRIFSNNCCCISFFNVADKITEQQRTETFSALCVLFGIAIFYLLYDLRIVYRTRKQKTLWEFLRSPKIVLLIVSIFSMIVGFCCSLAHYATFRCAGKVDDGKDEKNSDGICPNVFAFELSASQSLRAFFALDAVSNISFITSKILILKNILRTVQIGLEKSPQAPNVRLLSITVTFLWILCLFFVCAAIIACANREDYNIWYVVQFASAFSTFIFAMISTMLYIKHTSFHLNRYLNSLKSESPRDDDVQESGDVYMSTFDRIKMLAMNSPTGKIVKTLSGSLRRLQFAVLLILLSFSLRAVLYVLLFNYFLRSLNVESDHRISAFDFKDRCNSTLWGGQEVIVGRSVLGSPLLIPVITMFADPILMMCIPPSIIIFI